MLWTELWEHLWAGEVFGIPAHEVVKVQKEREHAMTQDCHASDAMRETMQAQFDLVMFTDRPFPHSVL